MCKDDRLDNQRDEKGIALENPKINKRGSCDRLMWELLKYGSSGMVDLCEEIATFGSGAYGLEGQVECMLCSTECGSVVHMLWVFSI